MYRWLVMYLLVPVIQLYMYKIIYIYIYTICTHAYKYIFIILLFNAPNLRLASRLYIVVEILYS